MPQRDRRQDDRRQGGFDIADFLGTRMAGGKFPVWAYGIACSGVIALYGLSCVIRQSALFIGGRRAFRSFQIVEYSGHQAVALGVSYIAAAVFMHCHFCWSEHEKYNGYAALGKLVSLLGGVAGIVFLVFDSIFIS
jgi:hypothetical protein